jgi:hypothetical protein
VYALYDLGLCLHSTPGFRGRVRSSMPNHDEEICWKVSSTRRCIMQGLPATMTSSLAMAATRLKAACVLVKQASIIETLGAASRIASDKTGTLTQNRMTVVNCWVSGQFRSAAEVEASVSTLARSVRLPRISGSGGGGLLAHRVSSPSTTRSRSRQPSIKEGSALAAPDALVRLSAGTDILSRMSVGSGMLMPQRTHKPETIAAGTHTEVTQVCRLWTWPLRARSVFFPRSPANVSNAAWLKFDF